MNKIFNKEYYYQMVLRSNEEDAETILSDKTNYYHELTIPKKKGTRILYAIERSSGLYQIQTNLNKNFLAKLPVASPACGFVKGCGYQDYLIPHCRKQYHMRLDIRNFFNSITKDQIERALEEFVEVPDIRVNIIEICMLDEKLPQGAITSPAISNLIFRRIDQRILKYCQAIKSVKNGRISRKEDIIYTRYADDLLFSSDYFDFRTELYFYGMIKHILRANGFRINTDKTYMTEGELSLSGFVIQDELRLSRSRKETINIILHYFDGRIEIGKETYKVDKAKLKDGKVLENLNALFSKKEPMFHNKRSFINYLCGYRAFLIGFLKSNPPEAETVKRLSKKVRQIEQLIDVCQEHWFHLL